MSPGTKKEVGATNKELKKLLGISGEGEMQRMRMRQELPSDQEV